MKMKKFGATEKLIHSIVEPIALENGYSIWDVAFEKEGAYWYLRIFIDSPNGITIADCEKVTKPMNNAIDAVDPISQAYILEIGSAGLERELNQPWHFEQTIGMEVRARAVRPTEDGTREWIGILKDCNDTTITLETETEPEKILQLSELSYVHRYVSVADDMNELDD